MNKGKIIVSFCIVGIVIALFTILFKLNRRMDECESWLSSINSDTKHLENRSDNLEKATDDLRKSLNEYKLTIDDELHKIKDKSSSSIDEMQRKISQIDSDISDLKDGVSQLKRNQKALLLEYFPSIEKCTDSLINKVAFLCEEVARLDKMQQDNDNVEHKRIRK